MTVKKRRSQSGRKTAGQNKLSHVIPDLANHLPYLIGSLANHLATTSSVLYRALFDIGLTEWRMMWVLAIDPGTTARLGSQKVGLDKAAASRAIAGLKRRGLVRVTDNPQDSRERMLQLSAKGEQLYRRVILVAKERERMLFDGFTKAELAALADFLKRLHPRATQIRSLPPRAFETVAGVKPNGSKPRKRK